MNKIQKKTIPVQKQYHVVTYDSIYNIKISINNHFILFFFKEI